jgi:predicted CxxxxCH...CXXCH cytochrome family protein
MTRTWQWITGNLGVAGLVLLGACLLVGCGSSKNGTGGTAQYYGNYHKPGWITAHPGQAVADVNACTACHELSILRVGSGVPTCLTTGCHHQATPNYAFAAIHGLRAKGAVDPVSGGSLVSCQLCHGNNFDGGPSANTCFTCHGVNAPHPAGHWRTSAGTTYTHTTVDPSNAVVCAQCHYPGSPKNPAGYPPAPAPAGTQPGCFNATLCHAANGAPHPVPFYGGLADASGNGHLTVTAASFSADCATCHAHSGTSPLAGAPLCSTCHKLGNPTVVGGCLSCHVNSSAAPDNFTTKGPVGGTTFPNLPGAHAKHLGLPTPLTCNSCHGGSGAGTTTHYDNADYWLKTPVGPASVALDPAFQSQSPGTAPGFNPSQLTCSSVSCHGGQATPSWQTGTIDSKAGTQCVKCHAIGGGASPQYTDAVFAHSFATHAAAGTLDCAICHNMDPASNNVPGVTRHFAELDTPAVSSANKLPSGTVKFTLTNATYPITGASPYNTTTAPFTEGDGSCALTCHGVTHVPTATDYHWQSKNGAAHPVPFLKGKVTTAGNSHLGATAANFTSDCATCHAKSGTSPTASAPACATCHTLGDPTAAGLNAGTCLSCHVGGAPASASPFTTVGPTGSAWPSLKGSHAKHLGLLTATKGTPSTPTTSAGTAPLNCSSCHAGLLPSDETDTSHTHYDQVKLKRITTPSTTGPAPVAIFAGTNGFKAQTGGAPTFATAAQTCSSVSCHGGQVSPAWPAGTLTVNATTYCLACHVVNAAQYNAPIGRHNSPGEHNQTCDYCHDMTQAKPGAQNHFKYLETTVVSGVSGTPSDQYPSDTVLFGASVTGAKTYTVTGTGNAQGKGGCALTCHSESHTTSNNHWN